MLTSLSLFALLAASPITAGPLPPPPIVNGSATNNYEPVCAIVAADSSYFYGSFCSCTLINRYWALTAAHCVEAANEDYRGYDIYVVFGGDLWNSSWIDYNLVSDAIEHPSYNPSTLSNDIGLLELAGNGVTGVDVMPVNEDNVTNSWIGDELTYVGFGITGDNDHESGDIKRYADIPVMSYDSNFIYARDTRDDQNVCSGDSGGAGLEPVGGGKYELAAVNSFVWTEWGGDPCEDGATGGVRVDRYISWINGYCETITADEADTDTDSDADSDTDSDSDADADADADSDADADADADSDADADTPWDTGIDDPKRPGDLDDSAMDGWIGMCSSLPAQTAGSMALLMAIFGLAARRREREDQPASGPGAEPRARP
jgi:secreted trypsin-like serine protease